VVSSSWSGFRVCSLETWAVFHMRRLVELMDLLRRRDLARAKLPLLGLNATGGALIEEPAWFTSPPGLRPTPPTGAFRGVGLVGVRVAP
jgi:hypothetical protein